jgi:leukotriene-A4 hydrolase
MQANQDTPGVKFTYSAVVTAPKPLRVLMSALRTDVDLSLNRYSFEQKVVIPSYLLAIAVGNLQGISVGPRTTVWSEPEVVEAAAWEFVDTENFLAIGEDLLSPYEWGIYDLLLLPNSFPYGGMENPCLVYLNLSRHLLLLVYWLGIEV